MSRSYKESFEQRLFFTWIKYYPQINKLCFHPANGGARTKREGARLKEEGVKPGVPDIILLYPSKGFHGLAIEMKIRPNKLSKHQSEWIKNLIEVDYCAKVAWSFDEAKYIMENYLI